MCLQNTYYVRDYKHSILQWGIKDAWRIKLHLHDQVKMLTCICLNTSIRPALNWWYGYEQIKCFSWRWNVTKMQCDAGKKVFGSCLATRGRVKKFPIILNPPFRIIQCSSLNFTHSRAEISKRISLLHIMLI